MNDGGQIAGYGDGGLYSPVGILLTSVAVTGDIDGDGVVAIIDFLLLLSAWGPCAGCDEDLDGSGDVDGIDLALLFDNWS